MRDDRFVHLHVHTEFSLLDGLSKIDQLMARAQELEMPAMAITDHGTMFGVIDFFRAAKKASIKPIIGVEAYLARRGMEDRDPKLDKRPYHMLLLAKNQVGYRNLLRLSSEAQLRGFYYQPRVDWELLEKYSEGIIATTGCLGAQVPQTIMLQRDDEARELIGKYQEVFGAENFFLELQYHDIDVLEGVNNWLAEYRKSGHTPVQFLATNDVHYVRKEDHDPHDTLLCIQTGSLKQEGERMRMTDSTYHLTSHEEMEAVIAQKYPWLPDEMRHEALVNTAKVAAMCDVDLETDGYHLPRFPVPGDHTPQSYLRYLCEKGLVWRYGDDASHARFVERLNHELNIIHTMGFDTYFLIVWDLCMFARSADIWWNVRGSGAGSLVAYSLGITNIDPIQNSLLFERFLNPGRVSMPDIDLDYPDDRRAEMIEYTARKYGSDKVAAIITFGTMGAKAAIRDVGRALNVPLEQINRVVGLIPTEARQKKIEEYVETNPELKQIYKSDSQIREVVDTAKLLQGVARHASTHAAGVIVADKPLIDYLPLHRLTRGEDQESTLQQVTQFPMETCESLGLLKVDFLGLSTLTIMRRASDLIERHHGHRWTMDNIPYRPFVGDDVTEDEQRMNQMLEETFEMIGEGHTVGVFQVESTGMQQMLRGMRPKKFEHIIAGISLYRPGPMEYIPEYNARMHGKKEIEYKHEKLVSILGETYGIITYQEQIMQIAGELFGYDLGDADLMRRAVSKKKQKELVKHREIFIERGPQNGVDAETAAAIFADIEFFANYGFNKSHAADYAVITVQTAFLKTHYPAEYMAALLSVYREDTTKVSTFLEECGRLGIEILPPDVNHSHSDFDIQTMEDGKRGIRFGLAAVKNASVPAIQHILAARKDGGQFEDLEDFCKRVDMRNVGKRTLESLAKVGAFNAFGTRPKMVAAAERMIGFSSEHHRAKEVGQMDMFGAEAGLSNDLLENLPNLEEASQREMLDWEKDLLGFYVTNHPIDEVMRQLDTTFLTRTHELRGLDLETAQDRPVSVVGLVANPRPLTTKKGESMCVMQLEDRYGTVEVVLFPRTWRRVKDKVQSDDLSADAEKQNGVVLVQGKLDVRRGDVQIIGDDVRTEFETFAPAQEPPPMINGHLEPPPSDDNDADDSPVAPPTAEGAVMNEDVARNVVPTMAADPPMSPDIDWQTEIAQAMEDMEQRDRGEPRWVQVFFNPSDDTNVDRRLIRRLYGIFMEHPGHDRFSIVVETPSSPYVLEFPNHTTGVSEELLTSLGDVVGQGNIAVGAIE